MQDALLHAQGLCKAYDGQQVLRELSFEVGHGEFVTLLGPSGCGKTTTLRILAGLLEPDAGRVLLEGKDITAMPPEKRDLNTVFQNYALFPHMNVAKNIAYGLRARGESRAECDKKVQEMLHLVQLEGMERRMPSELSGGQSQRVAIARAIVLRPKLLLLDEPLGALDLKLRHQMQIELKDIQKSLGIAFVYITHDQEEAINMSDRIALMNDGGFEQIGTPEELYERPATRFAAGFLGQTNLLDCKVVGVQSDALTLEYAGTRFLARKLSGASIGDRVTLSLRMERLRFAPEASTGCALKGTLIERRFAGGAMRARIRLTDGHELLVLCGSQEQARGEAGQSVYVKWNMDEAPVVRT